MPAEQKESSVLFSLKELMNLEDDRIKQEDQDKKLRAEAQVQARLEAERKAREEEERRLREEEDRRRSEDLRQKEEAARFAAIHQGEIERARIEAEQKARLEEMSRLQEHERHLKGLQHDEHKKKLQRNLTMVGAAGALIIVGVSLWFFGSYRPEQERREAAAQQELTRQQEEARKLQAQLADQMAKVNGLTESLTAAKSDAEKAAIAAQLAEAKKALQAPRPSAGGGGGAKPSGGGGPLPKCHCQEGDPLCAEGPCTK